jgi:hypothetical protein
LRLLATLPHLAGIVLMLGIFAAWAIPVLEIARAAHVTSVWSQQLSGRLGTDDFEFANWILNIPRGLAYLLPWAVLLPFARFRLLESEVDRQLCRGLSLGVAIPFLMVSLLPSALPRYNMPLLAPAIWLLAVFVREHALVWPKPLRKAITWTVLAVIAGMLVYSVALIPLLARRAKIRPLAAQLDSEIPPAESLYAIDPDYQPYFFYLHRPIVYLDRIDQLPPGARYVLVQPEEEKATEQRHGQPILRLKDYRGKRIILFEMGRGTPR